MSRDILSNISWLFVDKLLRMGAGLIVGVWVARYLGPDDFGVWNLAIAYTALFGSFINFGLESILVRELVRNPEDQNQLMGSAFTACATGAVFAFVLSVLGAKFFVAANSPRKFDLIVISSLGLLTQSSFVLNYFFQAKVQSKVIVVTQGIAFVIATAAKIVILLRGGTVIAFAWLSLCELVISSSLTALAFHKRVGPLFEWRFHFSTMRKLLMDGVPLMFANVASMIYMRVDQVMIGGMIGDRQVGLFSAAIRISEVWYFLPIIVGSSVFPSLVGMYDSDKETFKRRSVFFFEMLVGIGLGIAMTISLTSSFVVELLFGSEYRGTAAILSIHVWGGVFVCMGVASSYWLTIHGLQRYNFYRSVAGLIVNILLNLLLIPRMGALGAALASAISQMSALFLFDAVNSTTRPLFRIKAEAFFFRESRHLALGLIKRFA